MLEKVLKCLEKAEMLMSSVEYLGHRIDMQELYQAESNQRCPRTQECGEAESIFGHVVVLLQFRFQHGNSPSSTLPTAETECGLLWSKQHLKRQNTFCYRHKSWYTTTQTRKSYWHVMCLKVGLEQYYRTGSQMAQTNPLDLYQECSLTPKKCIHIWKKKALHVYSELLLFMLISMGGVLPLLQTTNPYKACNFTTSSWTYSAMGSKTSELFLYIGVPAHT